MADILTQLENAVATRLEPLKNHGLDVLNSPFRCKGAATATGLFYFTDETGDTTPGSSQTRTLTLKVEIQACDQRSHQIAYPYIEAVKIYLHRFNPGITNAGIFTYSSTRYVPYEDKNGILWIYDTAFNIKLTICEIRDIDQAIANLFSFDILPSA